MTDELKPCPFCGGKASIDRGSNGTLKGIACQECFLVMEAANVYPKWHTLDDLIARWNARADRTCRFELEEDREKLAEKAGCGTGEFVTQDMPQPLWTCSACGVQYRNSLDSLPAWMKHCPECGAKVVI